MRRYEIQKIDIIKYIDSVIGNLEDSAVRDKVFSFLVDRIYAYEDKIVAVCFFQEIGVNFCLKIWALIKSHEKIMSILDSNEVQCYTEEQERLYVPCVMV